MADKVVLGAHVSAAGGLEKVFANAAGIGAQAIQMFGSSPRQWAAKLPTPEEAAVFRKTRREAKLGPVFLHAPYLINLASPKAGLRAISRRLLADNLKIAELIGAEGVIFHLGSGGDSPRVEGIKFLSEGIKGILEEVSGKAELILENSAGGGGRLGSTLDEIAEILDRVNSGRTGICWDTAHALEAGAVKDYSPESVAALEKNIADTVGWKKMRVIHANDSKTPVGSNHDRHENIGEGVIGREGFKNLLKSKELRTLPWILEVPGFHGAGPDRRNLEILSSLAGK